MLFLFLLFYFYRCIFSLVTVNIDKIQVPPAIIWSQFFAHKSVCMNMSWYSFWSLYLLHVVILWISCGKIYLKSNRPFISFMLLASTHFYHIYNCILSSLHFSKLISICKVHICKELLIVPNWLQKCVRILVWIFSTTFNSIYVVSVATKFIIGVKRSVRRKPRHVASNWHNLSH